MKACVRERNERPDEDDDEARNRMRKHGRAAVQRRREEGKDVKTLRGKEHREKIQKERNSRRAREIEHHSTNGQRRSRRETEEF